MRDIKNILKKLKLSFAFDKDGDGKPYSIGSGFTSKTYHGEFKNKRAICKLSTLKNSKLKTISNNYLNKNIIKQLSNNDLSPNVLLVDKKNNLLIYEYIEDKKSLNEIKYQQTQSDGYAFQIEMTLRCVEKKLSIKEVPIIFNERRVGKSKMSKKIIVEALIFLFNNGIKRWLNLKII